MYRAGLPLVLSLVLPSAGAATTVCWAWAEVFLGSPPSVPGDLTQVRELSAGISQTCALTEDGQLRCWGSDAGHVPSDLGEVRQVSVRGGRRICALLTSGRLRCWDHQSQITVPEGLGPFARVSTGSDFTCAITLENTALCWSHDGSSVTDLGPAQHVSVYIGHRFSACAHNSSDAVSCWGDNSSGQLAVPVGMGPVLQLSVGRVAACARTVDRSVVCWPTLAPPDDLGPVADVSVGNLHACAVTDGGEVRCWGNNSTNQLAVPGNLAESFSGRLSAGWYHTCAFSPAPSTTTNTTTATHTTTTVTVTTQTATTSHTTTTTTTATATTTATTSLTRTASSTTTDTHTTATVTTQTATTSRATTTTTTATFTALTRSTSSTTATITTATVSSTLTVTRTTTLTTVSATPTRTATATSTTRTVLVATTSIQVQVRTEVFHLNRTALEQNETIKAELQAVIELSIAASVEGLTRGDMVTVFEWQADGSVILVTKIRSPSSILLASLQAPRTSDQIKALLQGNLTEEAIFLAVTDRGAVIRVVAPTIAAVVLLDSMDSNGWPWTTTVIVVAAATALLLAALAWWCGRARRRRRRQHQGEAGDDGQGQGEADDPYEPPRPPPDLVVGRAQRPSLDDRLVPDDRVVIAGCFTTETRIVQAGLLKKALTGAGLRKVETLVGVAPEDIEHFLAYFGAMVALVTEDFAREGSVSHDQLRLGQASVQAGRAKRLIPVQLCSRWQELCQRTFDAQPIDPQEHKFNAGYIAAEVVARFAVQPL